jgi:hypothetical protein
METTWEGARWCLAVMAAGCSAFVVVFNLLYVTLRFVWHRRVSSVPLIGGLLGIVALVAVPVSMSWGLVLGILGGLLIVEFLNFLWPASLFDPPNGSEEQK